VRLIPLTQGQFAIVDDEDYDQLKQFNWYANETSNGRFYARRDIWNGGKRIRVYMHCQILGVKKVDHRDGDGLNNKRSNIRYFDRLGNQRNRGMDRRNKSGFKGVSWDKNLKSWVATIRKDEKKKFLGRFVSPRAAALVYDAAAIKFHGEFSKTNQQLGLL
jgi:hypothetical protein